MSLKAEQHSQIAAAYEQGAADGSLPAQTRAAFARKAVWFRLLARVGEKRERAALIASERNERPTSHRRTPFWRLQSKGDGGLQRVLHRVRTLCSLRGKRSIVARSATRRFINQCVQPAPPCQV